MRVLVTGASGYVGGAVLSALNQLSLQVVTAGRRPVAREDFIEVDLLSEPDFGDIVRRSEASHLIHLAWEASHGVYWTHWDNPRWALATARLVESFCKSGGRGIVVAGSCAEYNWEHGWCRENAPPSDPSTLYGASKEAARRLSRDIAHLYGVPLAWGRIFLSYGRGEDPRRLVPSVFAALKGERPCFSIDVDASRDFLHISDVGAALVKLLTCGADGVANVCSGTPVQLREIVIKLAQLAGRDPQPMLALAARRPNEPRLLAGEPSTLTELGWAPRFSLEDGLGIHAKERE